MDSYMKATAGSLLTSSIRIYFNYILVNLLRFNDSFVGSMVLKSTESFICESNATSVAWTCPEMSTGGRALMTEPGPPGKNLPT